eukprot:1157866-Pelagomonas_calceolata.AAC.3
MKGGRRMYRGLEQGRKINTKKEKGNRRPVAAWLDTGTSFFVEEAFIGHAPALVELKHKGHRKIDLSSVSSVP